MLHRQWLLPGFDAGCVRFAQVCFTGGAWRQVILFSPRLPDGPRSHQMLLCLCLRQWTLGLERQRTLAWTTPLAVLVWNAWGVVRPLHS